MILLLNENQTKGDPLLCRVVDDGFAASAFTDGMAAYDSLKSQLYDLFFIDLDSRSDLDGWELLQLLKRCFPSTPILVTAEDTSEKNVLKAYHYGCNEFIKPPVYADELLFRIRTLLGWRQTIELPGGMRYLPDDHRLFGTRGEISLTSSEQKLLHLLLQNIGKVVPAGVIEEMLWEECASEACRHTLVSRVRKKLGKELIKTLPKVGYTIDPNHWKSCAA